MKCQDVLERIDDFVDGDLSEAEFQEVELHLASCAACRAEERELRALLAEAAALPKEIPPDRELWSGIAGRIGGRTASVVPFVPRRVPAWGLAGLAAAAAVVVAIAASLVHTPATGTGAPGTKLAAHSSGAAVPVAYPAEPAALQAAEADYVSATRDLMTALDARRSQLAPETLDVVDRNLKVIDTALDQIHAALAKDPSSPDLARMLTSTHQKKIDVLRHVLKVKA